MRLPRRLLCRCIKARTLLLILLISCTLHLLFFVNHALNMRKNEAKLFVDALRNDAAKNAVMSKTEHKYTIRHERTTASNTVTTTRPELDTTTRKPVVVEPRVCSLPGVIHDGVPWPNCVAKLNWMKGNWKKDPCYATYGVSDDACSMLKYLAEQEPHCPPNKDIAPKSPTLYLGGEAATPRTDFGHLYREIQTVPDYLWIKNRIQRMESLWINNSKHLFSSDSPVRKRKRIHLHLGLMSLGIGKDASKGGPLGELVQWSDLIASMYVMGHDIVITSKNDEVTYIYKQYKKDWGNSGCPPKTLHNETKVPFDLIYTDITGLKQLRKVIGSSQFGPIECRVRIVDSFGTEASFNHPSYRAAKKIAASQYNGIDANLQQFNTMFPHSPDNTFLGFVTEFAKTNDSTRTNDTKRDIALVYGKIENFWKGKEKYIDIIKEYVSEVHATVHEAKNLSPYIINHGVVSASVLGDLLQRTKIFVGLGFPFEGPAPLEAIQCGAVFLNPKFPEPISSLNNDFYRKKPTRRKITSQSPYAEKYIGKPYVYTVDTYNETALREALSEIVNAPDPGSYLSYEFSVRGMLERVSVLVEKQQFCTKIPYSGPHSKELENMRWPPISALKTFVAKERDDHSCNEICDSEGLICEPSFFSVLNRAEGFHRVDLVCKETKLPPTAESDYPAYDNGTCYLQTNPKLFSCAENHANIQRLCPCRDFIPSQVALCKQCGLS